MKLWSFYLLFYSSEAEQLIVHSWKFNRFLQMFFECICVDETIALKGQLKLYFHYFFSCLFERHVPTKNDSVLESFMSLF